MFTGILCMVGCPTCPLLYALILWVSKREKHTKSIQIKLPCKTRPRVILHTQASDNGKLPTGPGRDKPDKPTIRTICGNQAGSGRRAGRQLLCGWVELGKGNPLDAGDFVLNLVDGLGG